TESLPLNTVFQLGPQITPEQHRFLDTHGFLHFRGVASPDEVEMLRSEVDRIAESFTGEGRRKVRGIPIFYGRDKQGAPLAQRLPFTSTFSESIRALIRDERFEPVRRLIGEDARIGDEEKDGLVANRFVNVPGSIYPRLGWHTDGLRDIFYGRMPQQMLNVGLHLDRCYRQDGGLRLIPGTHLQGFVGMAMGKPHFVWHKPDPQEICVETEPGDLTIHDGRLWHRVARSQTPGAVRRSMYVPYLTGPVEPKHEESSTPGYHYLGRVMRSVRNRLPLWALGQ
ncbi:MAG: phytanoyl-CoA dioxygenase family protein, partial [Myxococcota bacterium]|nr:phytanoyl-CoA dioxygenase family protein [Myxococcota bacterium]